MHEHRLGDRRLERLRGQLAKGAFDDVAEAGVGAAGLTEEAFDDELLGTARRKRVWRFAGASGSSPPTTITAVPIPAAMSPARPIATSVAERRVSGVAGTGSGRAAVAAAPAATFQ